MFKAIISRDNGEPWGSSGMTTQRWIDEVPGALVHIPNLIATQPGVYLSAIMEPTSSPTLDPLPHVILWEGELYLEDGHHRVVRAMFQGERYIIARVLQLPCRIE